MKLKQKILLPFAVLFAFTGIITSCIKSEEPNAEADILTCTVSPEGILKREPTIGNSDILLMIKRDTDLSKISLDFTLTEGATIDPPSGKIQSFIYPQQYTVTSEDKKWKKTYTVRAVTDIITTYQFEETIKTQENQNYHTLIERDRAGNVNILWASGNAGFSLTGTTTDPELYPTVHASSGYKGNCVKLTTRSTGKFGKDIGLPIAAGNLFLGTFNAVEALKNPLSATLFGLPFDKLPTRLTGYYKYQRGKEFLVLDPETKEQTPDPNRKDICDIYGVFYETDENFKSLDGSNSLTHPNIVALARIKDAKETSTWTSFDLEFEYGNEYKPIDYNKVKNGDYNIAIVFTSSIEGHLFNGAIGSTLYIDEVELEYEDLPISSN